MIRILLLSLMAMGLMACKEDKGGNRVTTFDGSTARPLNLPVGTAEMTVSGAINKKVVMRDARGSFDEVVCAYDAHKRHLYIGARRAEGRKYWPESISIRLPGNSPLTWQTQIGTTDVDGKGFMVSFDPERYFLANSYAPGTLDVVQSCDLKMKETGGVLDVFLECPQLTHVNSNTDFSRNDIRLSFVMSCHTGNLRR
ncbi:MAG: hypothetical protein AB7N80_04300 [Bdellovibrionales bacterium]